MPQHPYKYKKTLNRTKTKAPVSHWREIAYAHNLQILLPLQNKTWHVTDHVKIQGLTDDVGSASVTSAG